MDTQTIFDLDVVVLAGGLGTRLAGQLGGRPKVLAPVGGVPFLDYLLATLVRQGVRRVILALGFRADAVVEHLARSPVEGLEIVPVIEPRPLGTAGALANTLPVLKSDPVLVLNGDTFVEVNLPDMLEDHLCRSSLVTMVCVRVPNPERFGRVEIGADGSILSFREKDATPVASSWINAGAYLFARRVLENISGSLERDVLPKLPPGSIRAFQVNGRFLDIGTPADLEAADRFFSEDYRSLAPR